MKYVKKARKGVIGPLGDDIPSIFPIVFAILLFTGSILYANQMVAQKAKQNSIREGAMALSYLVTENGFISKDSFEKEKLCGDKLKPRGASLGVTFLITYKRFCNGIPIDPASDDPNLNPYSARGDAVLPYYAGSSGEQGETWFYCSNEPKALDGALFKPPAQSVLLSFPIAVPCPDEDSYTNGLGVVNVISWK